MKNNARYTALEILKAVGVEKFIVDEKEYAPEEVFGKVSIVIGGISGIVNPLHILGVPLESETLQVVVGVESFEISLEQNDDEREHSESVQLVKEEQGRLLPTKEEVREKAKELSE